jgi:hypothetical protein
VGVPDLRSWPGHERFVGQCPARACESPRCVTSIGNMCAIGRIYSRPNVLLSFPLQGATHWAQAVHHPNLIRPSRRSCQTRCLPASEPLFAARGRCCGSSALPRMASPLRASQQPLSLAQRCRQRRRDGRSTCRVQRRGALLHRRRVYRPRQGRRHGGRDVPDNHLPGSSSTRASTHGGRAGC